jgi:ABC-type multidrug transport system fused ATPase/permease subunit
MTKKILNKMDKILVLKDNTIQAIGNHDTLFIENKYYREVII